MRANPRGARVAPLWEPSFHLKSVARSVEAQSRTPDQYGAARSSLKSQVYRLVTEEEARVPLIDTEAAEPEVGTQAEQRQRVFLDDRPAWAEARRTMPITWQ